MTNEELTQEEIELFRQTMTGTKPISEKKIEIQQPKNRRTHSKTKITKHHATSSNNAPTKQISVYTNTDYITEVSGEEQLFFARTGLQTKTIRQLRKGQLPIEAKIDLHGLTINEAEAALTEFLNNCRQQHIRHILVVHGKGSHSTNSITTIKSAVNAWLREPDFILAFCSAQPHHGGTGALYALLKSHI